MAADGFPPLGSLASVYFRAFCASQGATQLSQREKDVFWVNYSQWESSTPRLYIEGYTWFPDPGGGRDAVICSALFVWGPSGTCRLQFISINALSRFPLSPSHFSPLFQVCFLDSPMCSSTSFQSVSQHVILCDYCARALSKP